MSNIWKHVTKSQPCPICNKSDWCQFGDRAMKCMRVESAHADPKGGWYHFYDSARPDYAPKAGERRQDVAQIDVEAFLSKVVAKTTEAHLNSLAERLGVTAQSLKGVGCGYSAEHRAYSFPMFDGNGNACGIRLRSDSGFKWTLTGSRQGVFFPVEYSPYYSDMGKVAFLPEGPTDLAAVLSLGLFGIGRPINLGGADEINSILRSIGIYQAVIIADNDEMKKYRAGEGRPGIEGAVSLQKKLKVKSVIWIPPTPCKDVREFYRAGGTKEMILSDLKNKIWKNG